MSKKKATIKCGTINPNTLKIAGKPNRAMTPEVKLAPVWIDRKNDYRRHKEKQKIRRNSDEYGNGGFLFMHPVHPRHKPSQGLIFLELKINGTK